MGVSKQFCRRVRSNTSFLELAKALHKCNVVDDAETEVGGVCGRDGC